MQCCTRLGNSMYKKSAQGWLKHLDFIILDVICLWISFTMAFGIRHRNLEILTNSLYRDMIWSIALLDIVVIFFFDSYKNVLKRGFYQEFTMTLKHDILLMFILRMLKVSTFTSTVLTFSILIIKKFGTTSHSLQNLTVSQTHLWQITRASCIHCLLICIPSTKCGQL